MTQIPPKRPSHIKPLITEDELLEAVRVLGRNKAAGVDYLTDSHIRKLAVNVEIRDKLRHTLEKWLQSAQIPQYCKQALIISLSKEESQYPTQGNVRPIAIVPTVTKLYETIILGKLYQELQQLKPLSKC